MRKAALALSLLLAVGVSQVGWGQTDPSAMPGSVAPPLYRVSFQRREAVSGISALAAIALPWDCASDGTIFVDFVSTVPANAGLPPPPPVAPPRLLTSVSPTGRGQVFRLDQVPGLYISSEQDHYVSDAGVVFLVKASRENKPVKHTYIAGSYHGEYASNAAEQRLFLVNFNRDGEYQRAVELGNTFHIRRLGQFPSGTFLAFGYDEEDHSPKLAMLNEDGTFLKSLQISKGDAPELFGTRRGRGFVTAPAQFVPEGRAILLVQNKTSFPLLEVGEGGTIRPIHPKLPTGELIQAVIPADRNLYVIGNLKNTTKRSMGVIHEVSPENGDVLRSFALSDKRSADDVACVSDGKFLSIDYGDGQVVPLVGTPEPVSSAAPKEP
jgi:hypothetical protein